MGEGGQGCEDPAELAEAAVRIAILDDYQSVALRLADWSVLPRETEVVAFGDHVSDQEQLVMRLAAFDAVCLMRERTVLSRPVLERLPRLKLVLATGGRNGATLDIPAARALGITVCETASFPPPTVELTWWLILSLFRQFHREHAALREGGWQVQVGASIWGKTLGILGLGHMGKPVAAIAAGFGMKVVAWSPNLTPERAEEGGAGYLAKDDFFRVADAITIHMPLSERSRGLVGAAELSRMKPGAFLINTSRAAIVDQRALVDAMLGQRIGGLGVDVFEQESLPRDHPFRYLPNVVATPHLGYVTEQAYRIYLGGCVENAQAWLGGRPINVIS